MGQNKVALVTKWSYQRVGYKAGFYYNIYSWLDFYFPLFYIPNHGKPQLQGKTKDKPNKYKTKALTQLTWYKKSGLKGVGRGNFLAYEKTDR